MKDIGLGADWLSQPARGGDRVGLKRLLADGHNQYFDVIVAWREDRLYRGYRPMLDVLDCIDETGIDIELVKETFDKRIAPVKAWAARMELDAKHDRFMMGVAGRLAQGKAWNGGTPYGYEVVDDQFVIDEAESIWVQRMWQWFGDGELAFRSEGNWLLVMHRKEMKSRTLGISNKFTTCLKRNTIIKASSLANGMAKYTKFQCPQ